LRITEIQSIDALEAWETDWNSLVEYRPLRSTDWLLGWWKQFQTETKHLNVWLIHQADELVGIAPLYQSQVGTKTVLRMLGDAGDICTDHTTWFAKPGLEEMVGETVATQLLDQNSWSRMQLASVDEQDAAMAACLAKMNSRGATIHSKSKDSCWAIDLPDTWDDYLMMLSKNHRKRCRRWIRTFYDTGRVEVHVADETNIDEVWKVFLSLHRQRWGDEQRPDGSFSGPGFTEFHEAVSRELFQLDQLRLSYIALDGQPIAAEYQLIDHETLYSYQSGMSPDYGDVSPGNLSLIATIQFCLDRGLKRLDFLRGDESYKSHWKATPSARNDIRIWPSGVSGQIGFGIQKARQIAADWIRR